MFGSFPWRGVLFLESLAPLACMTPSHPPELGDCVPIDDASCTVTVGVTGSSGSGDEAGTQTSACPVSSSDSLCNQCAFGSCCAPIMTCSASADCSNLDSCVVACNTSTACVQSCEAKYPDSVGVFQNIESCVSAKCPACNESSAGDPCSSGYPACIAPFTCNGLWCTRACATSADYCTGIGPNGGNIGGSANVCVFVSGVGDVCVPGCWGGCGAYPGTYCQATTAVDQSTVQVCAVLPDGG